MLRGEMDAVSWKSWPAISAILINLRQLVREPYCSDNDNDGNEACALLVMEGHYGWFVPAFLSRN